MSAETPAAPKKSKKLLIIVAAVLLLGGGGAGAAWFVTQKNHGPDDKAAHAKKEPAKKPLFTPLEPFTVNLQDERGERFAQIGVTLQLEDPAVENELKDRLPAVRNQILLLISSKRIDELLSADGKKLLAEQIRVRAARAIGVDVADVPVPAAAAAAPVAAVDAHGVPVVQVAAAAPAAVTAPVAVAAAKPAVENPVKDVLFSQFIVQ